MHRPGGEAGADEEAVEGRHLAVEAITVADCEVQDADAVLPSPGSRRRYPECQKGSARVVRCTTDRGSPRESGSWPRSAACLHPGSQALPPDWLARRPGRVRGTDPGGHGGGATSAADQSHSCRNTGLSGATAREHGPRTARLVPPGCARPTQDAKPPGPSRGV